MEDLVPEACLGLSGGVYEGVQAIEIAGYGRVVAYPVGSMVVIKDKEKRMFFLKGHSHNVSCVAASRDGRWLASGQNQEIGVEASIFLWELSEIVSSRSKKIEPVKKFALHIGKVQAVAFSADTKRLASLGGRDDNKLIVWDLLTGEALAGARAANDSAKALKWLRDRNDRIVTVGKGHLRVWQFKNRKLHAVDAVMAKINRIMECVAISHDDAYAVCGTTTGEVVLFDIYREDDQQLVDTRIPRLVALTSKERFGQGVTAISFCPSHQVFIAGAGDGTIACFEILNKKQIRKISKWQYKIEGGITSISCCQQIELGTTQGNRYVLRELGATQPELRESSHLGAVRAVAFPSGSSELFVTCSQSDIRIWGTAKLNEILRIRIPNLECTCLTLSSSGNAILSGWSDGKIRAFGPESGTMLFQVPEAHPAGVTAIVACEQSGTNAQYRVLSGGADGCVRIWNLSAKRQTLVESMKEHRSAVTKLIINKRTNSCLSSSKDGTCIFWCLEKYIRLTAIFDQTLFLSAAYHPDGSQIITAGANGKITYWEAFGSSSEAIRELIGSDNHEINALELDSKAQFFLSGSNDSALTLWDYNAGIPLAQAHAHAGPIHSLALAPDQSTLVSTGNHAIFLWRLPKHLTS